MLKYYHSLFSKEEMIKFKYKQKNDLKFVHKERMILWKQ